MRHLITVTLAASLLVACHDARPPTSPLNPTQSARSDVATDSLTSYIVTLRKDAGNPAAFAQARGISPTFVYLRALNGFAAALGASAAASLANEARVASVEPDGMMYPTTDQTPAPSWGLDRVDQRTLPLNGVYRYASDGTGVQFFDIDTGLRTDHTDFAGRIGLGVNLSGASGGIEDCNGHGTHTAGTVAGTTYGVAKKATIHPVRVFGCTGGAATSVVIAAIDWVTTNATLPAVVNMSLGGSFDAAMNQAVANSIASGIVYSVSAGNSNTDACSQSPASAPDAITVGASDIADNRAYFSNYGACVDLYAPGVSITSDWYTSSTATNTISGTSMSAPHVTGAAALILSLNPTMSPADVAALIAARSTKRALIDPSIDGDLLYTGTDEMATPPGSKPIASFTFSCVYTTCAFTDHSTSGNGAIVSWAWSFGSTAENPTATFHYGNQAGGCCYTEAVTLSVVDAAGFTGAYGVKIATISPIALTATAVKSSGNVGRLVWTGARGDSVVIVRYNPDQSRVVITVRNTGAYDDTSLPNGKVTGGRGKIGYSYTVYEQPAVFPDWQSTMPVLLQ